jgi:hypothetical protein
MLIKGKIREEIKRNEDLIYGISKKLGIACEAVKDLLVELAVGTCYKMNLDKDDIVTHLEKHYLEKENE